MPRTTESFDFVIPPTLARKAAKIAREEGRTSGALFDDMLDMYQQHRKQHKPYDEAWAMNVIREAQEEERLHPMSQEELKKEDAELRRYGIAQTKKLGLKAKDIDRLLQKHSHPSQRKREGRS